MILWVCGFVSRQLAKFSTVAAPGSVIMRDGLRYVLLAEITASWSWNTHDLSVQVNITRALSMVHTAIRCIAIRVASPVA